MKFFYKVFCLLQRFQKTFPDFGPGPGVGGRVGIGKQRFRGKYHTLFFTGNDPGQHIKTDRVDRRKVAL